MSERYPGKRVIGLTGNIAVGKSLVMGMLAELGAATIDADSVAHEVMLPGGAAYDSVIRAFGDGILDAQGHINRPALGAIVFSDAQRLRQLENITHPAIRRRTDQLVREAETRVAVIEAIKLLEGPTKDRVDQIWVVDATPATQLRRLINERGMSEAEAIRRIEAQNPQADKLRQADVVIQNDGDIAATRAQVKRAWDAFCLSHAVH